MLRAAGEELRRSAVLRLLRVARRQSRRVAAARQSLAARRIPDVRREPRCRLVLHSRVSCALDAWDAVRLQTGRVRCSVSAEDSCRDRKVRPRVCGQISACRAEFRLPERLVHWGRGRAPCTPGAVPSAASPLAESEAPVPLQRHVLRSAERYCAQAHRCLKSLVRPALQSPSLSRAVPPTRVRQPQPQRVIPRLALAAQPKQELRRPRLRPARQASHEALPASHARRREPRARAASPPPQPAAQPPPQDAMTQPQPELWQPPDPLADASQSPAHAERTL